MSESLLLFFGGIIVIKYVCIPEALNVLSLTKLKQLILMDIIF